MSEKEAVLKVEHLYKKYGDKQVLKDVSFSVFPGEVVGLVGANGSGKSTTFKAVCGLTSFSEGEITIDGCSVKEQRIEYLGKLRALIETPVFYEHLSGYQNLKMDARMYNVGDHEILDALRDMELEKDMNLAVKKYSLGMKQRLGICRVLLGNPELVLLDEPINGLDVEGIFVVRKIIERMAKEQNKAVLISSHILTELERVCDRILFLIDGSVREIQQKGESLEEAYRREILGEVHI